MSVVFAENAECGESIDLLHFILALDRLCTRLDILPFCLHFYMGYPRLPDYDRGRIVGRFLAGQEIIDIARIEGKSRQTIQQVLDRDILPDGTISGPPTRFAGCWNNLPMSIQRCVLGEIDNNQHITTKQLATEHHI